MPLKNDQSCPTTVFSQQHLQRTNNHSGVLCEACQIRLSLSLGTALCLDNYSYYYLFLVIPFALAGLTIVFLLLKSCWTRDYQSCTPTSCNNFLPTKNWLILTNILEMFIAWLCDGHVFLDVYDAL